MFKPSGIINKSIKNKIESGKNEKTLLVIK